jgi:hypothetical protein
MANNPEWLDYVRPGDVLKTTSGRLRVVRRVTRWGGKVKAVHFVKLARSRYRSPTTIRYPAEMRGWVYLGARLRLDSPIDRRIACTMDHERDSDASGAPCNKLTQDDVIGVVT